MSVSISGPIKKGFFGNEPLLDAKAEKVANVAYLPSQDDFNPYTGVLQVKGIDEQGIPITRNFQLVGSGDKMWVGWTNLKAAASRDRAQSVADANAVANRIVGLPSRDTDNFKTGCRIVITSPDVEGWYKPVFICLASRAGLSEEGVASLEFFNNLNATDTDSWAVANNALVIGGETYIVFVKTLPVRQTTTLKYLVKLFK